MEDDPVSVNPPILTFKHPASDPVSCGLRVVCEQPLYGWADLQNDAFKILSLNTPL